MIFIIHHLRSILRSSAIYSTIICDLFYDLFSRLMAHDFGEPL